VRWAIENREYSKRRACLLVGLAPKVYRHRSRRADDGVLRTRLKELAAVRRRFGYRRLHLLLRREGFAVNHKKLYRIYREERLVVRKRGGRKRALGSRAPIALPGGRNERWSLDFVSDALADGRRFRVLAIVDDFTRECLALVADTSLSGTRVARELDAVIAARGAPKTVVSDNGPELTALAMLRWQQETNVAWHYIQPGKPIQNAFVESFQWPAARRAVERNLVPLAGTRARPIGRVARRLQPEPPAHEPQGADTERVCSPVHPGP
jgi:putative transposase